MRAPQRCRGSRHRASPRFEQLREQRVRDELALHAHRAVQVVRLRRTDRLAVVERRDRDTQPAVASNPIAV